MTKQKKRTCGGCTMCCKLPEQRELDKPAGVVCEHCSLGTGCTIYKQRPQGCRDYTCLWLANPAISDELRPDKIGVVFEATFTSRICLALVDPRRPNVWQEPGSMHIISSLLAHDVPVVIVLNGFPTRVLPTAGRTTKSILADLRTEYARAEV